MKIAGYDDIKVDDVIEAFKIEVEAADAVNSDQFRVTIAKSRGRRISTWNLERET